MSNVCVLITAAGNSARMPHGQDKLALRLAGKTVLARTVEAFVQAGLPDIFIVGKEKAEAYTKALVPRHPFVFVAGGKTRQESVYSGLRAIPSAFQYVLIHDGARPFVSGELITSVVVKMRECGAAVPGMPLVDTVAIAKEGVVDVLLPREKLVALQTPQGFLLPLIRAAHDYAKEHNLEATDDSSLVVAIKREVALVPGSRENVKITTYEDYARACLPVGRTRVGFGMDTHRLVSDRKLVLGGVLIPNDVGLLGHSDADVVVHAVMDALLGAVGLGDIGEHFPDTLEQFRGAVSLDLLLQVVELLAGHNAHPTHIDITLLLEKPKIASYKAEMRANLAGVLGISEERVNIKATTNEGLGYVGAGEGATCYAVATVTCAR